VIGRDLCAFSPLASRTTVACIEQRRGKAVRGREGRSGNVPRPSPGHPTGPGQHPSPSSAPWWASGQSWHGTRARREPAGRNKRAAASGELVCMLHRWQRRAQTRTGRRDNSTQNHVHCDAVK
jgi:hypothetical protein